MSQSPIKFGLTLANRGVILGITTTEEMLASVDEAEEGPWDSVWVGDSILAKPRLDALVLLGALASRTARVKLGVACFASAPLRDPLVVAYQWASLDYLSNGRTIFVSCQGQPGAGGGRFSEEFAAFGIDPNTRMGRMEEGIEIMRLTSSRENVSYRGKYRRFDNVTVLPRPKQQPIPIWVTANANPAWPKMAERALRRVARYGDGWMTTAITPAIFAEQLGAIRLYARDEGRELPAGFEACIYHNVCVAEDRESAFLEAKKYLDLYYESDYPRPFIERWVAHGKVSNCIDQIKSFIDAGATTITLRVCGFDHRRQFETVTREILPALL
jgi:alkanesulfonate monooxygenase SsuD/methylene tetrahydromethanopterin reductase-like flavin-dependent oxidoreductase (luciferase family)